MRNEETAQFVFLGLAVQIIHMPFDKLAYPFGRFFGGFQPMQNFLCKPFAFLVVGVRIPVLLHTVGLADVV